MQVCALIEARSGSRARHIQALGYVPGPVSARLDSTNTNES